MSDINEIALIDLYLFLKKISGEEISREVEEKIKSRLKEKAPNSCNIHKFLKDDPTISQLRQKLKWFTRKSGSNLYIK